MALDATWIPVPLAVSQVRDKEQINLAAHEARTLFDIDVEQARGSWTMRRGHERLFDSVPSGIPIAVGEYVHDGISYIVIICRSTDYQNSPIWCWRRKSDGSDNWIHVGINDFDHANYGDVGLELRTNEVRVFGNSMVWKGNVRAIDMHRFNTANGPLTVNPVWDENDFSCLREWFSFSEGTHIQFPNGFPTGTMCSYYISALYEGGEESNVIIIPFQAGPNGAPANFRPKLMINNAASIPKRIKSFRIYRSYTTADGGGDRELRFIANLDIYKTSNVASQWQNWSQDAEGRFQIFFSDSPQAGYARFFDITGRAPFSKSRTGQTDYNSQIEIAPLRRRGRIFADRAFYWRLTDDTGTESYNRLYYSHYSGDGVHCPDIVLPANYIEFNFNIQGLVEAGTHRIVVGDVGFAVGYMRGSVNDQWQVYQGKTRVGCASAETIAETPFGAVFLGYDGIYVVASLQYQGPFGQGIFREIENHPNLSQAIAGYSQQGMRYYLYIPGTFDPQAKQKQKIVPAKFYCMDLNTEDKRVRELSTPDNDEIYCFGFGLDGTALFATEDGVFRAEELSGDTDFQGTPLPQIETGLLRFASKDHFQQVNAIALDYKLAGTNARITIKGYPSGIETIAETESRPFIPPSDGGKLMRFNLSARLSKDLAHAVRIETIDDNKVQRHPSAFAINALQLLVQEVDGTL
jgi:hypothetical protein